MEMNESSLNRRFEGMVPWLFAGALLLGIAMRLINLGAIPLSDPEAIQALNAYQLAEKGGLVSGNQPLYVLLTSFLFSLFGSSDLLARVMPALLGCLLLLVPIILQKKLGDLPAVLLTTALAIDPSLVALSRQAGSIMPAISLTLLGLSLLITRRRTWAGICLGLAILSGPGFWFGITAILATMLLAAIVRRNRQAAEPSTDGRLFDLDGSLTRPFWLALVVTAILSGSLFLLRPSGISLVLSGLLDYLAGWTVFRGTALSLVLTTLVLYLGIPFVIAFIEGIRGSTRRSQDHRSGMILIIVILGLICVYPGRSVELLAWSSPFIWLYATWLLSRLFVLHKEEILPSMGHAILVLALLLFILMNIAYVLGGYGGLDAQRIWAVLGGSLVILIISFLVAYGWGIECAIRGLFLGLGAILLSSMFSLSISAGGLSGRSYADLWRSPDRVSGARVLDEELERISLWTTGTRNSLAITVIQFDRPSMRWMLRDEPRTEYVGSIAPNPSSEIFITPRDYPLELSDSFRGESFAWYTSTDWQAMDTLTLFDWILHRTTVDNTTGIILWVRPDLFLTSPETSLQ